VFYLNHGTSLVRIKQKFIMPWNPEVYNQYKEIRYKPFYDLSAMLIDDHQSKAVDLGCGTGEQTFLLSQKFKQTSFLGIDSSSEMLSEAKELSNDRLSFKQQDIASFLADESRWDLIFSNAALQWVDDHEKLFPALISKLNKDGQLAVQMPLQKDNTLNKLLNKLVQEEPFQKELDGFRRESPLLSIDEYAQILFENGLSDINISVRTYPIIADNAKDLYDFISGSTLIPYMEKLDDKAQALLRQTFLARIEDHFKRFPAIYPFKRILMYAVKS